MMIASVDTLSSYGKHLLPALITFQLQLWLLIKSSAFMVDYRQVKELDVCVCGRFCVPLNGNMHLKYFAYIPK